MFAVTDSGSDSESRHFFNYARSAHHMMRRMGYNLQHGNGLNIRKGRRDLLRTFILKGKPGDYYNKTCRGWDILHHLLNLSLKETNLYHHIPPVHLIWNQMSVWGWSSKTSLSIWFQSINWSKRRLLKHLTLSHGPSNSISNKRSNLNGVNPPTKDRVIQVDVGSQAHPKTIFISERSSFKKERNW